MFLNKRPTLIRLAKTKTKTKQKNKEREREREREEKQARYQINSQHHSQFSLSDQ